MDVIAIGESLISLASKPNGLLRHASSFIPKVAGSETNMLIGLSRLGHDTKWISRLGDDELGKLILSTVRGEGVDTSEVSFDEFYQTGIFFKELVNETKVRVSYYRENSAASQLSIDHLNESSIAQAKYLFITGITLALSESCRNMIYKAIEIAKQNNVTVVFDPNLRKKLWSESMAKKVLLEIASRSDIILPGVNEGHFLLGTRNSQEIAEQLINAGNSMVVVKLGADGAYYATESQESFVNGYYIENVIDPVGAGDGFAAGLISGLLDELSAKDSVKRACIVGALATTVQGDFNGLPDRKMLSQLLNKSYKDEVQR